MKISKQIFIYVSNICMFNCITCLLKLQIPWSSWSQEDGSWITNVSEPHKHFLAPDSRRDNPSLAKGITPNWTQDQTAYSASDMMFPVLNNHEFICCDIGPSPNSAPRYWHVRELLALSWVTAVALTCVCRRWKSTVTGWNNNCALITHWSLHWVTAEGDCLTRQHVSYLCDDH